MRVRQNYPFTPKETTIRGTEAIAKGGYALQRSKGVVIVYQFTRHHIKATAITITCWSAVCQVGPMSLL
jgi:hypothetical protein